MYTEKRFCELTKNVIDNKIEPQKNENNSNSYTFEAASHARIRALAEILGIEQKTLVNELLNCALGDAHDGFLAAHLDSSSRDIANKLLKSRVKELL